MTSILDRLRPGGRSGATDQALADFADAEEAGEPLLLATRGVDVHYGQVQVLFDVDFAIRRGEIVALLGTNGAGKSTLLSAISGLITPSGGAVAFDGRDITGRAANRTVGDGIVLVPGGKGVFPTLSVEENLNLAGWLFRGDEDYLSATVDQVLEYFPILRTRWAERAGNLSGGEQQMLTLGQAFIAKPTLLMIDELSLGLAPLIVGQLLEIVRAIHANGTTLILVEQSVNVAVSVAERAVFMEKGEIRFDGPTERLLERPDILRAVFLGGAAGSLSGDDEAEGDESASRADGAPARTEPRADEGDAGCKACADDAPVALEVHDLGVSFGGIRAVDGVTFSVREREILGIVGPNGAGKTTVFDSISGFVEADGRVVVGGIDVSDRGPDVRAMHGLGRSFQDARLFPALTVAENLAVALERHVPTRDPVAAALGSPATRAAEAWVRDRVAELVDLMTLQAFANKFISELSTGTRRVVDLAASLAHDPTVLLLDEPSSGIAQRETEALQPLLMRMRDQLGAGIVVIEHDIPLVSSVSDHMLALELGRVIARGTSEEVLSDEHVVESYLGESEDVILRSGRRKRATDEAPNKRLSRKRPATKTAASKKPAKKKRPATKAAATEKPAKKKRPGKKAAATKRRAAKKRPGKKAAATEKRAAKKPAKKRATIKRAPRKRP